MGKLIFTVAIAKWKTKLGRLKARKLYIIGKYETLSNNYFICF